MAFGTFGDFRQGFDEDVTRGSDDITRAFYEQRDRQGLDDDATRMTKIFGTHPVIYRAREVFRDETPEGKGVYPDSVPKILRANPDAIAARQAQGMGPKSTMAGRLGQLAGSVGHDLVNDKSRSIYWLLNAAQATGNVINENALAAVNPELYGQEDLGIKYSDMDALQKAGHAHTENKTIVPNSGIKRGKNGNAIRRNYRSGAVAALGIPAGFAINQGLGLMTPFGGYEGYEAVLPSQDDPSKTSNVIGEVAAKYIMGRTGNLLPYDEFQKVRPDVSKGEYNAYKAFKFDKKTDLNPFDDGQMTLPTGIIKTNDDGIHGAEVQFLGRSLPVNTALIPFAGAVAGGMAGVAKRPDAMGRDRHAVKRGLIGSAIGTAAGMTLGNLLEGERRRRNAAENGAGHDSTGMM